MTISNVYVTGTWLRACEHVSMHGGVLLDTFAAMVRDDSRRTALEEAAQLLREARSSVREEIEATIARIPESGAGRISRLRDLLERIDAHLREVGQ